LAHPGGPVTTNKAAALAKFLERKLQEPGGLDTLKPELIELAVKNAKETVNAIGTMEPLTVYTDDEIKRNCRDLDLGVMGITIDEKLDWVKHALC
uniref:Uncharacterized protein n=1 Tax=Chenopodium quinoa TaxID=63459 RepID=A0A803N4R8_CHEQI